MATVAADLAMSGGGSGGPAAARAIGTACGPATGAVGALKPAGVTYGQFEGS